MSLKRQKRKKRWLNINGKYQDCDSSLPESILNTTRKLQKRPIVNGHKNSRFVKDSVYFILREQIRKHEIQGPYLGLAAAYTPEIYELLAPYIYGEFCNCQNNRSDYKKLLKFQPSIVKAYPEVYFHLEYENIINVMKVRRDTFAILDLDFMWILNKYRVPRIASAISHTVRDRSTVAIWHSANRVQKNGDWWTDNIYRPALKEALALTFKVLEYNKINYYESYPMRCDIYTLERKKEWKKALYKIT